VWRPVLGLDRCPFLEPTVPMGDIPPHGYLSLQTVSCHPAAWRVTSEEGGIRSSDSIVLTVWLKCRDGFKWTQIFDSERPLQPPSLSSARLTSTLMHLVLKGRRSIPTSCPNMLSDTQYEREYFNIFSMILFLKFDSVQQLEFFIITSMLSWWLP